jgi:tetratricopeptide (TPR) repeat protein
MKAGALLPIADLNGGFMRPKYPDQVMVSYYQAGLLVEWIEAQKGLPALLGLLKAYGEGKTTAQAFQAVLGTSPDDIDKAFFAHLEQRFAGPLAALRAPKGDVVTPLSAAAAARAALEMRAKADPGDFEAQRAIGLALFHEKKPAEALPYLERARALFPDYAGDDGPSWFLAQVYRDQGRTKDAIAELSRFTSLSDTHYRAHVELARLLEAEGDLAGAARTLERALYISPFEPAVHEKLAALGAQAGDHAAVVRARRSLVALDPVDKPEALYQLAVALEGAGDAAGARREVLRALELAPRFERAQRMLLRLHAARAGSGTE